MQWDLNVTQDFQECYLLTGIESFLACLVLNEMHHAGK